MAVIREKKHRLPAESYRGPVAVAFTACIRYRTAAFVDAEIVRECEEVLLLEAGKSHCEVIAYVFMPDHCHIILQGKDDQADAMAAMVRFKQKTGYWFSKKHPELRWQKDFYDRYLRDEKDVERQVAYVLANPVRKGMVENWGDYPFCGSTVHHFDDR